jgi:thiopeptide-type bacteriocin biosynthesis protein
MLETSTNVALELTPELVSDWASIHIYIHDFDKHDHFLTHCVALLPDDLLSKIFFIRYWEGGPHIRLRIRFIQVADQENVQANVQAEMITYIESGIRHYLQDNHSVSHLNREDFYAQYQPHQTTETQAKWYAHHSVEKIAYHPETARYGGSFCMRLCEDHFCWDSSVALKQLHKKKSQRHALAFAYCLVFLEQLQHYSVDSWNLSGIKELHPDRPMRDMILRQSQQRYAAIRVTLQARLEQLHSATFYPSEVQVLRAKLELLFPLLQMHSQTPLAEVANSLLHMSFNRFGLSPNEEAQLRYLAVRTFNENHGHEDYHLKNQL